MIQILAQANFVFVHLVNQKKMNEQKKEKFGE